ncbi:MAG: nucleoside deaminase [Halofilum sp. (in: g-proteobacteria)]|nr:nucleoside deaminase [Halofilum sp. (in: g-proteobacteria)]
MIDPSELSRLHRCIELAKRALENGHAPFGAVLAGADGRMLAEDHNRAGSGDATLHPEFELARWAARELEPAERASSIVYTSGEHCPMCAAAHAMVGLGRIVYIVSSRQFEACLDEFGRTSGPVRNLSIPDVAPGLTVEGPVPDLADEVLALYRRCYHPGD